jgi:RHS repeat-associated protein
MGGESYDANGNTTSTGGKTYAYDSENHLKSMNGGAVTLLYDGDGNRVAKTVSGVTTRYLVDDLNPTGYAQVVEESTNGSVQRSYSYGLQRIDVIQLVNNTSTLSFYGYDGFGNVRQLTNSAGAVTDTYEYDAFGTLLNKTGTTPNNYLYRGEQWDSVLNLYYLRARYYNPTTGRFLSRDPENGKTIEPKTLHKYLYADGDPTDKQDPTGRVSGEYIDLSAGPFQAAKVVSAATLGCQVLNLYNFLYTSVSFFVQGVPTGFGDPGVPWWVKYGCAGLGTRGLFR